MVKQPEPDSACRRHLRPFPSPVLAIPPLSEKNEAAVNWDLEMNDELFWALALFLILALAVLARAAPYYSFFVGVGLLLLAGYDVINRPAALLAAWLIFLVTGYLWVGSKWWWRRKEIAQEESTRIQLEEEDKKRIRREIEQQREAERKLEERRNSGFDVFFNPSWEQTKRISADFAALASKTSQQLTAAISAFAGEGNQLNATDVISFDCCNLVAQVAFATGPVTERHFRDSIWPITEAIRRATQPGLLTKAGLSQRLSSMTAKDNLKWLVLDCLALHSSLYGGQKEVCAQWAELYVRLAQFTAESECFKSDAKGVAVARIAASLQPYLQTEAPSVNVKGSDDALLLGLSGAFDDEQLRTAWLNAAKQWHPDKLEGMAPELKEYATGKLSEVNAAYERLKARV